MKDECRTRGALSVGAGGVTGKPMRQKSVVSESCEADSDIIGDKAGKVHPEEHSTAPL